MNIEDIRQLVADLTEAGLAGAEIERPGFKLSLKRGIAMQIPAAVDNAETGLAAGSLEIKADSVGRLLDAHPDDGSLLAPIGSHIEKGQLVALLAVGHLLLPVRSQHAGQVAKVLAPSGETVSYGQPLISLSPYDAEAVQP